MSETKILMDDDLQNKSVARQEREQKKKKREYNSRSRSQKRKRSRSKSKKHKSKHHKDHKDRKHSRDKERSKDRRDRDRQRQKYRQKDKDSKKDIPKKEVPLEVPMPLEVAMPSIPGERRKRQRSRSPLDYYRRNQHNNEAQFWDSFSWVPRINYIPTVSSSALANTKKMRRLLITNIPFQIGITEIDLRNLITRYMSQNYLKDEMNECPVVNMQINETEKNVAVQLSSVEQTCRICKLQKIQLLKGAVNGILRLGDSCYGNNVVTQAQTAAQAQAAAFAAINVLENKKTQFNINSTFNAVSSSAVIRVTNAMTIYIMARLSEQQWLEYEEDLLEGFSQFGTVVHHWFVRKEQKDICADPGDLFIQYQSRDQAEKAMAQMQQRIYDQRTIKLYYVPKQIYTKNFQKNVTPPEVKK